MLYTQLLVKLPYPKARWEGKTVVVTGANTGLGLEAARHFARLGAAKVILGVRSIDKGNDAKRDIESTTGCGKTVVDVWPLDLLSYESVRQFAACADADLPRVDAVVENAGIARFDFVRAEGEESTITTNVISTFLLGLLLLPKLRATAARFNVAPHLVVVSSGVHGWTTLPERSAASIFDALADEETARMDERYHVSKLLEVFAVRELAQRCRHPRPEPVVVNCLNPGLCHSTLTREADGLVGWIIAFQKWLLARTTEAGSRTLVHAASAGPDSHGQYLSDCAVKQPASVVTSEEGGKVQKRVWEELCARLDKIQPGILRNLDP